MKLSGQPNKHKSLFLLFYSDHSTSPVVWRGCGSSPPSTPLISMSNIAVVDFSSNFGSSGSGFRIVAEEISSGCGGILHGMVRSWIFTKLSVSNCYWLWCHCRRSEICLFLCSQNGYGYVLICVMFGDLWDLLAYMVWWNVNFEIYGKEKVRDIIIQGQLCLF